MDPEKIKPGDFLTFVSESCGIEIGRVMGFERFDKHSGEMASKVFYTKMLVFPSWSDRGSNKQWANVERYYIKNCAVPSSETEVKAWLLAAEEYLDGLRKEVDDVSKLIQLKPNKARITPDKDIGPFELGRRLPDRPNTAWNWMWSFLQRKGLWKPDIKKEKKNV